MSNINELNQKIAFLNAECQRVNNERAVNIGKHDTLSKQLDSAIKSYNEKYGKNITVDSLEQEIKTVMSTKEKEIANLEAVLNAIKSGDYNTANSLVNGETVEPVETVVPELDTETGRVSSNETVVTPAVAEMITPPKVEEPQAIQPREVVQSFEAVAEPAAPVVPPVVQAVTPPVVEPIVPITPPVIEPVAPPVVEPVAPPVMTPPPVMSAPPQMTPPPVASPNGAPKSFAAILGGTAFEQ